MFKRTVLDDKLKIITVPMEGTNTITILVLCGTGSDYESKKINGISHFLEHMFFKGTKSRPNPEAIKHELDGMGSISNAFTTHELTGYYIKAAKTYLDQSLDLLADIYRNSTLPQEEIDRERQVVIEEMHRDHDTPTIHIGWVWENLLYGNQPAGWDVIGEEKIIRELTQKDFKDYFYHQYVASNTAVVIAGNFEESTTIKKITNLFSGVRNAPPLNAKPKVVEDQKSPEIKIAQKDTDQTHIAIGFRGYHADHPRRYTAEVLAALLGGSWSSRMWDVIREKMGLAYTVWTTHDEYSNRGYMLTYAGVDHKAVNKTVEAALKEYKRIITEKISIDELERVKNYLRGTTLINLEASNAMANFVGIEEIVTGKPLTPDEMFAKISAITPEDLRDVGQDLFRPENLNCAMIGPIKDEGEIKNILSKF